MPGPPPEYNKKENARRLKEGLENHIRFVADKALRKHGRMDSMEALSTLLKDPEAVRFPAEIRFGLEELGEVEPVGLAEKDGRFGIILHPAFEEREEDIIFLALYTIPNINYGKIAKDKEKELFASLMLGIEQDECRKRIERLKGEVA